ncbi:MAG: indole-3-glycerol phosphate synthase TrpC, partial [Syntrophales bacterium]|nr:indole-3-glycerol phosphate synthase TrpC [Syntrophales bacterium]
MILDRIIAAKKKELEHRKISLPIGSIMEAVKEAPKPRDFMAALEKKSPAVIAEIKRSSPSKGRIAEDFDPLAIARNYERGGASALSVLTEEKFFEGSIEYLARIRRITGLPLVRKDFIIDPYQIYETRVFGGDALLL